MAAESKIIKQEERKFKHPTKVRSGLQSHRVAVVASECRSAHIAYGFLKGKSYTQIETNPKTKPNWNRIQRIVEKYGVHYFGNNHKFLKEAFEVWKYGH